MKQNRFGADIFSGGDSVSPMDGVANLADVMLVLAVGMMLALVINWNVRLSSDTAPPDSTNQMEEIEPAEGSESSEVDADGYTEVGRVFKDPATGKLYMVIDDGVVVDLGDGVQPED
jgi:hypothetical protein